MKNKILQRINMILIMIVFLFPAALQAQESQALQDANRPAVTIAIDTTLPPVLFGTEKMKSSLRRLGMKPVVVDHELADGTENVRVDIVQEGENLQISKEGFRLENSSGKIVISAIDGTGAMYGLMELSEQIHLQKGLSEVASDLQNPRFPFRAIKFNLPWSSYRRFSALQVNESLCKDLEMWEAFLDMMAENRFNVLTLWNLHPFPYLIRAKNFLKATPFSDQELAEWKHFWSTLFEMAKNRGIDTYLVNWNVFVSEEFKKHYDPAGVSDMEKFLGDIKDTETIRRYTRECITQVINEYPNLTGLGVTLGERMENLDSEQQTDWVEDVFFRGIKEANRPVKFIYRAALKGDHAVHRVTIDNSGLPEPIWVELKFNWSHGHSTPTLVKGHGGGTGEEYWTNPPPRKHKMCWMIRNEDFFRLRWGEPDFIRAHIAQNGQDFVGGYFIGSETMIPAKDIFHKQNHEHVNWDYAFERQWLFYKEWGRLLYNPKTPDAVFSHAFDFKYKGGHGEEMVEAFKLSTRTNQRILSFFRVAQDATNYAEGFLGHRKFLTIRDVIESTPTDPNYVSVEEFGNGSRDFGAKVTPIELAEALEVDATEALTLVNGISTVDETLTCEIEDVKAWSYLSLYFAKKLRAAVAINQKDKTDAIKFICQAQQHWVDLASVIEAHIIPGYVYGEKFGGGQGHWHWNAYQDEVDDDVEWVKSQVENW